VEEQEQEQVAAGSTLTATCLGNLNLTTLSECTLWLARLVLIVETNISRIEPVGAEGFRIK
jgi:hypothetical protein